MTETLNETSQEESFFTPNWEPFAVLDRKCRAAPARPLHSKEGIGDRLRTAAFAELQAFHAFNYGAEHFKDASEDLKQAWKTLAISEERHLGWLLNRMNELHIPIKDRPVSDWLWVSLVKCKTASEFAVFMASAEERGRIAGVKFYETLLEYDAVTAEIFGKIAEEEIEHIRLATKFFPEDAAKRRDLGI